MTRDVTPNLKPFGICPCGLDSCGLEGKLKKAFSDGVSHVVGCPCRRCMGRRSKSTGGKAQRTAVKRMGMAYSTIATGHEENLTGFVRLEAKSGGIVRPLKTAFDKAKAQSDASRPVGDNRPFVFAGIPEPEGKRVIYAFECRSEEELLNTIAAFAQQLHLL